MADFNLPPGCSTRDVDRAAGETPEDCNGCGNTFLAYELEDGFCDRCIEERETE